MHISMPKSKPEATCPSGRCREGALLIGLVDGGGRIRYLGRPEQVEADFVNVARVGRPPEMRFRFAEPCARENCGHWTGAECGLVEHLLLSSRDPNEVTELPSCGIRRSCVWFAQRGPDACRVCPLVIHTPPDTESSTRQPDDTPGVR
jgi:hypothetical protein